MCKNAYIEKYFNYFNISTQRKSEKTSHAFDNPRRCSLHPFNTLTHRR